MSFEIRLPNKLATNSFGSLISTRLSGRQIIATSPWTIFISYMHELGLNFNRQYLFAQTHLQ